MISVITPVYNGEKFIESCIKVVIEQNCLDVEHIIVDGGSTDTTVEIIKQYAEKYPHIRWISEKDQGQSDAMNKGIAMAKGEILAILNVDDYYEPNVLNRVAEIFQLLPEPSFLAGNCKVWDDRNNLENINKPKKLKLAQLLLGHKINPFPINPSAYFYHRSLHEKIGLYDINEHYSMDVDFLLRAVQVATVKYVNQNWGNYRRIEGTKTVIDCSAGGQSLYRLRNLMRSYRKNLPILQRILVTLIYETFVNLERITYFITHPQLIIPRITSKLNCSFPNI